MFQTLKKLFQKYKEMILYIFFGAATTGINFVVFWLFTIIFGIQNTSGHVVALMATNVIAWIVSVAFAYVTNKLFVFESRSWEMKVVYKESVGFIGARLFSLGVDLLIMYIGVTALGFNKYLIKLLSNVIVIILNYIASKLFIFKKEVKN